MILGTEDDVEVVGEAPDGERAVWETERLQPDVVLMERPDAGTRRNRGDA